MISCISCENVHEFGTAFHSQFRLRYGGFSVQVERVRGRLKKGGPRHTIFLGHL